MANNVFLGGATATTAQVTRFTPANVEIGDVFTLTVTGADGSTNAVSFTATAATVANVTAGLTSAWNASTNALCTPITAADATTSMTLTADTAGVPFFVAATTTDGGGANTQTLTKAVVTANSHAQDWGTAANWLTGAVPASGDSVTLDGRAANDITRGLYWQDAVALAALNIKESFTRALGAVGGTKLRIGATNVVIGEPAADGSSAGGSSLVNLYITGSTSVRVVKARGSGTSNLPATQIKLDNNASTVTVLEGSVGIGTDVYAETVTMNALTVSGGGRVEVGEGVSFSGSAPKINQTNGSIVLRCAVATIEQDGGTIETAGSGAITTANIAGQFIGNSTGTITTLEVKGSGSADFSKSTAARTITNATLVGPTASLDCRCGIPLRITITNGVDCIDGADPAQSKQGDEVNAAYTAA